MNVSREKVIVFGSGGIGVEVKEVLEGQGKEILCFVDNNYEKWNTSQENILIFAPEKIKELSYDYIAIGVYKGVDSIKKQLIEMGISQNKIVVPVQPQRAFYNNVILTDESRDELPKEEAFSKSTLLFEKEKKEMDDLVFFSKIESLKVRLAELNIPIAKVCVVSGGILQAYGIRKSFLYDDIDIIMTSDFRKLYGNGLVIVSDTAEMHPQNEYDVPDDEIILKNANHFVYRGVKFMNISILHKDNCKEDK